jgi:hypothetical protein
MIAVAGAAARKAWAGEKPAPRAAAHAEAEEEDDDSADSTPAPAGEASSQPSGRAAEPPADKAESRSSSRRPAVFSHFQQGGISIMPGTGYRVVVPYKDSVSCGDSSNNDNKRVCSHVMPFFLDLQLSYGLDPRVDLIVDLRFALQRDPAPGAGHEFALAPGFRYWLDQGVALKFYATGQLIYDYTNYLYVSKGDFAIRNADGVMYDAIKNLGFFFQVGWTMGFVRWFRMEFDAGLGVQLRFP